MQHEHCPNCAETKAFWKSWILGGFSIVLAIGLLGAASVGSNPYRVENIRIGGGPSDADGGTDLDKQGNITASGTVEAAQFVGAFQLVAIDGVPIGQTTPSTGRFTTLEATGKTQTAASASGGAGLNVPHGTAPSSPVNGDLWSTSAGLFFRVNGVTIGPLIDVSGIPWTAPGAIGSVTPNSGAFTTGSFTGGLTLASAGSSTINQTGVQLVIQQSAPNVNPAGSNPALIDLSPIPGDNTSNATFRAWRSTDTSGLKPFSMHSGDNTTKLSFQFLASTTAPAFRVYNGNVTIQITLAGDTGNVTLAGDLRVNGGDIFTDSGNLTINPQGGLTTVIGDLTVGNNTAGPRFITANANAGSIRGLQIQSAGSNRWRVVANNTAESGSDTGSPLIIGAFNDGGTLIDTPVTIVRAASGEIGLARDTNVSKALVTSTIVTFTDGQSTPSVAGANVFRIPASVATPYNITSFTGGKVGQQIIIVGNTDADQPTCVDGTNLKMAGNFTLAANDTIMFLCIDAATPVWVELSRRNNGA